MLGKRKFLISGLIIILAIGYLAYSEFQEWKIFYYKVSELRGQGGSLQGENLRINGQVAADSVERELDGLTLRFTIIEGGESLPVVYEGVVPDAFKVGSSVVVEGHLNSAGIFQADSILTKCPSKYVPEE